MTIPTALLAHIRGPIVTIAWCWKITRKDGQVFGFTTHVKDLVIGGMTYSAATGFMVTALDNSDGLSVDNLEISGVLSSVAFTTSDFQAGLWDAAALSIFFVNYLDLTMGQAPRFVGQFGEVKRGRVGFTAEQLGLTEPLSQRRGELTSKQCRAVLGDSRCKVNLVPYTRTGTISSPTSRSFVDAARTEPIGWWAGGNCTITSGASVGRKMEIKKSTDQGYIELVLPILPGFAAGDSYSMTPGCNHLLKAPGPPQTQSAVVFHVFDQETVTATGITYPAGYFAGGVLTWTSGNNAGRSVGILTNGFDGTYASFGMETLQGGVINVNDQFYVTANAAVAVNFAVAYLGDCKVKFANVLNFQGEPEIPGIDRTSAYGT